MTALNSIRVVTIPKYSTNRIHWSSPMSYLSAFIRERLRNAYGRRAL